MYLTLTDIKGTDTSVIVDIAYSTLASNKTVAAIFAVILTVVFLWAIWERKTRVQTVKHMETKTRELERKLDANRSSSNLTAEGKTNPEDL